MNNDLANIGQHRRHTTVSKEMVRPPGTNKQKQPTEADYIDNPSHPIVFN
jgi:hypothetical protein